MLSTPKMQNKMLKDGKGADILENEHMKESPTDLCQAVAIQIQYLAITTFLYECHLFSQCKVAFISQALQDVYFWQSAALVIKYVTTVKI